jgi:gamma-glutamyltranspeptidase
MLSGLHNRVPAQAGLEMLAEGGSAVDAALAAAITLTLVEPVSNGIGSAALAIVWDGWQLHGLNASGRSPAAWTLGVHLQIEAYMGFGSGVVVHGTGVSLQNRGTGFVTTPGHPNLVGANKRPYHPIIPGFMAKVDAPVMSFGVMGGTMQPQGHLLVVVRIAGYGQNPQAACDGPRFSWLQDMQVRVEGASRRRRCRSCAVGATRSSRSMTTTNWAAGRRSATAMTVTSRPAIPVATARPPAL